MTMTKGRLESRKKRLQKKFTPEFEIKDFGGASSIPVYRANGCICLHSTYTAELILKDTLCPIHGIGGLKSK